jgi:CHAT domain-containing protein/tetratricopeptide (TPR) repeat protein
MTGRRATVVGALALCVFACSDEGARPPPPAPAIAPAIDATAAEPAPGPRPLVPGEWLVDRLTGRDAHTFVVPLQAGQAAVVTVDGREVNTRIVVDGPGDRNRYFVEDLSRAVPVVEEYVIVARESGEFRLTLQAMTAPGRGGELAVRAQVRAATERDRLAAELADRYYRLRRDSGRSQDVIVEGEPPVEATQPPAAVFEQVEVVLALARRLGDRMREGRLLGFQGDMRRADERFDEAARLWRRALDIARAIGDRSGEATALNKLGWLALTGGDIATDLRLVREALDCCRAIQNLGCIASSLNELGEIHLRLGDPERALTEYRESAAIRGELGQAFEQSMTMLNVALAYAAVGDAESALAVVDEAETLWRPQPGDGVVGDGLVEIGYRTQVRGMIHLGAGQDPARALGYFEGALTLGRQTRMTLLLFGALSGLSDAYREVGKPARALALAREALEVAGRAGVSSDLQPARITLARALYANGELAEARAVLADVAARARAESAERTEADALTELARTLRGLGDRAGALASVRAAVARIESARARIHADGLRATYLSTARDTYDLYVELLLDGGGPGDVELALAVAEQARARTLREILTAARARSPALADPALARAQEAAREAVRVQEVAHSLLLERDPRPAQVAASRRELTRRVQAYQEIDARVRARDPGFARLLAPPALDVVELRARLADDETLLVYNLGDGASTLWLVSRAGVEVMRLPGRAILEHQIRMTYALLTARATDGAIGETAETRSGRVRRADAALPAALEVLGHFLLGPARDRLRGARLLIVPDGGVAYVPFAALPDASGRALLERYEILHVPAGSLLVGTTGGPARLAAPRRVAIVADPVFSTDDPRVSASVAVAARAEHRGASFSRLTASAAEAERIAALATGAVVATGFAATEAYVRQEAFARADIVHFATHSVLDADAPELSAIVLSLFDEHGRPRDGLLRLHEIVELRLDASLAVLSACETALGRGVSGEGLIGLVRGFLHAGARQVMASFWRVHDQGTAELMTRFYAGVLGGHRDAAAALRDAQLAVRADPRWSAPYYWASFGLQGVPPRYR